MTALTAFELLIKCERARVYGFSEQGNRMKNDALDSVIDELHRNFVEILTPEKGAAPDGGTDG